MIKDILNVLRHSWWMFTNEKLQTIAVAILIPIAIIIAAMILATGGAYDPTATPSGNETEYIHDVFYGDNTTTVFNTLIGYKPQFNTTNPERDAYNQAYYQYMKAYNKARTPDVTGLTGEIRGVMPGFMTMSPGAVWHAYNSYSTLAIMVLVISFSSGLVGFGLMYTEMTSEMIEPVILTPVKTIDFIIGKCVSAVLVTLIPVLVGISISVIIIDIIFYQRTGVLLPNLDWIAWVLLVAPLVSMSGAVINFLSNLFKSPIIRMMGVYLSQIPGGLLFFIMSSNYTMLTFKNGLICASFMAVFTYAILLVTVRLFDRDDVIVKLRRT